MRLRFFTFEDWHLLQSDPDNKRVNNNVVAAKDYLDHIVDKLPVGLINLEHEIQLLGSSVIGLSVCQVESSCNLNILAYDQLCSQHDEKKTVMLSYTGMTRFAIESSLLLALPGPSGLGAIGTIETEILSTGHFQQMILLSTGIVLCVCFSGFAWRYI